MRHRRSWSVFLSGLLCCVLCQTLGAQAVIPGNVARHTKISSSIGGLMSVLEDGDKFGVAMSAIGDLDGDHVIDLAVGAYQDDDLDTSAGAVHILFMETDGTVKASRKISGVVGGLGPVLSGFDQFGVGLAGLGDLDGDGVGDLAVGAEGDDTGAPSGGAVWILFLNADGTVKSSSKISEGVGGFTGVIDFDDRFGRGLARLGDLDGDGITELAVGAPRDGDGGSRLGAVWILFLDTDGTVKSHQKISALSGGFSAALDPEDAFGFAVAALGDRDADGIPDLLATAQTDDDGGTDKGALYVIYLNANGTVKNHHKISQTSGGFTGALGVGDRFGSSVVVAGDIDGNGQKDFVVGARRDDNAVGNDRGAVWVLLTGHTEQVIKQRKISGVLGGLTATLEDFDQFGGSVAALGDVDGDGLPEVAVGCTGDDDGGPDHGAIYELFLADGSWSNLGNGLAGVAGEPQLSGYGTLQPSTPYLFRLTNGPVLGQAYGVVGEIAINAAFKGGVMVPTPTLVLGPVPLDSEGLVELPGTWPAEVPSGLQSFYQFWLPDVAAPLGFSASNAMVITQP